MSNSIDLGQTQSYLATHPDQAGSYGTIVVLSGLRVNQNLKTYLSQDIKQGKLNILIKLVHTLHMKEIALNQSSKYLHCEHAIILHGLNFTPAALNFVKI